MRAITVPTRNPDTNLVPQIALTKAMAEIEGGSVDEFIREGEIGADRLNRILKAPTTPATLSSASAITDTAALDSGFFETLRHSSAFFAVLNDCVRLPFLTAATIATTPALAYSNVEGRARPLTQAAFTAGGG